LSISDYDQPQAGMPNDVESRDTGWQFPGCATTAPFHELDRAIVCVAPAVVTVVVDATLCVIVVLKVTNLGSDLSVLPYG
jgi:hypothetical protein